MTNFPDLKRSLSPAGETRYALGDPLVDSYLEFVDGRPWPTGNLFQGPFIDSPHSMKDYISNGGELI